MINIFPVITIKKLYMVVYSNINGILFSDGSASKSTQRQKSDHHIINQHRGEHNFETCPCGVKCLQFDQNWILTEPVSQKQLRQQEIKQKQSSEQKLELLNHSNDEVVANIWSRGQLENISYVEFGKETINTTKGFDNVAYIPSSELSLDSALYETLNERINPLFDDKLSETDQGYESTVNLSTCDVTSKNAGENFINKSKSSSEDSERPANNTDNLQEYNNRKADSQTTLDLIPYEHRSTAPHALQVKQPNMNSECEIINTSQLEVQGTPDEKAVLVNGDSIKPLNGTSKESVPTGSSSTKAKHPIKKWKRLGNKVATKVNIISKFRKKKPEEQ